MTASTTTRSRLWIPFAIASGTAVVSVVAGVSLSGSPSLVVAVFLIAITLVLVQHIRNLNRDIARVITMLDNQQRENTALISDKGAVLQMMRHRVRSNLQGVLGLLQYELTIIREKSARKAVANSIGRIMTLALVEETLEESGSLSGLDFGQFIERVVSSATQALPAECAPQIRIEAEDLILNPDTAFPAGLILGDVMAGLVKACSGADAGTSILVRSVREADNRVKITVSALGLGMIEEDLAASPIVKGLTSQLSGNLQVSSGDDYLLQFSFPEYFEAGSEMY